MIFCHPLKGFQHFTGHQRFGGNGTALLKERLRNQLEAKKAGRTSMWRDGTSRMGWNSSQQCVEMEDFKGGEILHNTCIYEVYFYILYIYLYRFLAFLNVYINVNMLKLE